MGLQIIEMAKEPDQSHRASDQSPVAGAVSYVDGGSSSIRTYYSVSENS